ncbi:MAG: hypothetical protein L0H96_24710 [Humibacillus sp.]|nr:hypothetical protein [Humibacillus sp.]MDN5780085.1 hypothetical protein [Humibacillus sp.]
MVRAVSGRVDPVDVEQLRRAGVTPVEIAADLQLTPAEVATALKQAGRRDLARPFWVLHSEDVAPRCRCGASTEEHGARCGHCVRVRVARAKRRRLDRRAAAHRAWLRHQRTAA